MLRTLFRFFNRIPQPQPVGRPPYTGIREHIPAHYVNHGPGFMKQDRPIEPPQPLGRWILIQSSYFEPHVAGAFLLDLSKAEEWAIRHAENVWSSVPAEQYARIQLPKQIAELNESSENFVSIPSAPLFHVLHPYLLEFYVRGWLQIWCMNCKTTSTDALFICMAPNLTDVVQSRTEGYSCANCGSHIHHRPDCVII